MPPGLLAAPRRERRARAAISCSARPRWACSTACPAPPGRSGASADVAATLGLPVLLLIDVSGQAQSAAAIVKGCMAYDPRIEIAGVVLNRVGSARHRRLAGEAIEALGVPVVGALPQLTAIALPERHLGLVQAGETPELEARLDAHRRRGRGPCRSRPACARSPRPLRARRRRPRRPRSRRPANASRSRATPPSPSSIRIWPPAGARRAPNSPSSRRSPTSRRRPIAISAGCPAAIPNCMRAASPARRASSPASGVSPKPARSTANAAAIWCSAPRSPTPTASSTPWPACSASRPASPTAG